VRHTGWTVREITRNLTLKQMILFYEDFEKLEKEKLGEQALLTNLAVAAAFGSDKAAKALDEFIKPDSNIMEEL